MSKAIEKAAAEEAVEKAAAEEAVERPYTLRKLKDSDLYPLLGLLRSLGIKDFKAAYSDKINSVVFNYDSGKTKEENAKELTKMQKGASIDIMLDMADILISKIDTHSEEIYEFYSGLSGIAVDEIKEMEFGTLPLMIYDSFNEVKNTAFFKVLSKLL